MIDLLTRRKVDLCSLQETRWRGGLNPGQTRWLTGKDSRMRFYWCGNADGRGGVGFMLAEKWADKVFSVVRVTDRILTLRLILGKQLLTFVALYAPQVGLSVTAKDNFYFDLQSAIRSFPDTEALFLLGDWNGHVGASADGFEDVHGGHGFGTRNNEGERILDFALANNLVVGNTLFIKRESHLVTFSSGGNRTQIDYVLYRKSFRKLVLDVKVIPGEEVVQQHALLVCDLRVSIPLPRKRKFVPRLRTWKLRDPAVRSRFSGVFRAKVADPVLDKDVSPVESAWSNLKNPLLETAKEVCGLSSEHTWRQQTWWWNEHVNSAIVKKRTLFKAYNALRMRKDGKPLGVCNYPEIQKAKDAYLEAKRHAKQVVWAAKSSASEEAFKDLDPQGTDIFRIASQMSRDNQDIVGENCVLNDAGDLALTDEQKMAAWVEHYSRLLNIEFDWPRDSLPSVAPTEGPPPRLSTEQVRKALGKMKDGKAAGPSGIIAEMLKASGDEGIELIRQLGESVFSTGTIPSEWEESIILNLYKGKGDALNRGNYRGLKLTDQVMKVLERVLDTHIREKVTIDKLQFGFVPGRGTTDAIFTVRQLQEKFRAVKIPLYFAFVDLEKAFDRIPRAVLWWALRSLGVEEWAVRVIQGMYSNARSRVRVNGQLSDEFKVQVGVHQGSVLSPLLFILVLEALSREFRTGVPWELLYADDLVIIERSLEACIEKLRRWKAGLEQKGLSVNMSKTKFMVSGVGLDTLSDSGKDPCAVCRKGVGSNSIFCGRCEHWVHKRCSGVKGKLKNDPDFICPRCADLSRPIDGRVLTEVAVDGKNLEVVDQFCYLGDMIASGGGCMNAITNRCRVAWASFRRLLPILTSRQIPHQVRGRVFDACVRSTMLHGGETWGPTNMDLLRLRRNDRAMLRWICGVKASDNISSGKLLARLGLVDVAVELRARRLRWYGHVKRSEDLCSITDMELPGRRGRGTPLMTWFERVRRDIIYCKLQHADPYDRSSWRCAVRKSLGLAYPL